MATIYGKNYGKPSLDLNFAGNKSLIDTTTGTNYVTFSRAQSGNEATYVGSDGLIKYASADEPRFDHDPETLESLGLLIEESRTNSISYSNEFNTQWSFGGSGVGVLTPNAAIAPDGTLSASKLAAQSTRWLTRATSLSGISNAVVKFNLSTGTFDSFPSTPPTSYGITEAGNGWYRVHLTVSNVTFSVYAKAGELSFINIQLLNSNAYIYSADGGDGNTTQGIYIWGAQVEAGAFPTSYIPTSGSTETRAADVASITGTNFSSWYNQDQGTFTLKTSALKSGAGGSILLGGISGAGYGEIEIFNNITEVWFIDYLNSPFRKISHDVSVGENRISASYDNQTAEVIAVNGTVSTTSQNFNTLTNVITGISLMRRHTQSFESNGTISRLTYYPKRLPDIELQQLTK